MQYLCVPLEAVVGIKASAGPAVESLDKCRAARAQQISEEQSFETTHRLPQHEVLCKEPNHTHNHTSQNLAKGLSDPDP